LESREIAEFTAFVSTGHPVTARLIVRRVRDRARLDELFPVWRHHRFLTTGSSPPVPHRQSRASLGRRHHSPPPRDHRDHVAGLIDRPLVHLPSGRFGANAAWTHVCSDQPQPAPRRRHGGRPAQAVARGATLRRTIVKVPARIAEPQRRPMLHRPAHRPWTDAWLRLWDRVLGDGLPPPMPA
jgi:hypothetical protein